MSKFNFPFVLLALLAMLFGLHLALIRSGYVLPGVSLAPHHAQVMVVGFLGSLIALERAVAIKKPWSYFAPPLLFLGSLLSLFYVPLMLVGVLGALLVVGVFLYLLGKYGHRPQWVVMGLAALLLAVGNALYAFGSPISYVLHYWILFLVLTIAGERLELSILLIPRKGVVGTFYVPVVLAALGALLGNGKVVGLSYALLALWLLYYDVATRNVRASGLVRFVALTLLSGYVWLLIGGLAWIFNLSYDLRIHSLTLGFVFGMIFAHAPIIFPAILGFRVRFVPSLYLPVVLLHLSLILRFLYSLKVGAVLGVISILLYFAILRLRAITSW